MIVSPLNQTQALSASSVGLMTPMTFSFVLQRRLGVGVNTCSVGLSSDVTLGDDHMIARVATRGLESNYFWARNPLQVSTCPPDETTVWIAAHPQYFKLRETHVPAMLRDHRSYDLENTV
jgi:hypothetical protein